MAYICSLVSARSAHLCAAAIAQLLERMRRPFVAIGADGAVYKCHPTFKQLMADKITELTEGKHKVGWSSFRCCICRINFLISVSIFQLKLVLSEDGSGRGAAVAAAIVKRMSK